MSAETVTTERLTDDELRYDLAKLQNREFGVALGRAYVIALIEEVLALRDRVSAYGDKDP